MNATRGFTLFQLAMVVLVALSGRAFSSTIGVGSCASGIVAPTIQQAVNASSAGDTVTVCPGTYREQVLINKSITLVGVTSATQDAAIIAPPTTGMVANTSSVDTGNPIAAQILVQGTAGPVLISNLTVDGAGNGITSCDPNLQGILFQNASGTVNRVAVRNQTLGSGLGGCQSGESIFVQTAAGFTSTVIVQNSSVHNYNKNGITGNDTGTTLTVTGSYVQGSGVVPYPGAAQNGIQLGFGAAGKISNNTVVDNIYGDPTVAASADILLYDTAENGGITVSSNVLGNSQLPIVLYTDLAGGVASGDGVSVTGNKIFGTKTYDAIDLCTNGNTVTSNTIFNSAESAVHLDASCGSGGLTTGDNNKVTTNTVVESSCAGILIDGGTTGETTTPNTYYTVPFKFTSSTAKCTIPARPVRGTGARPFSPAK
ncbi:MAG TPA: hypothetical protein VKD23_10275 [Terriglobales bacterium]|nr:hypothetical protein [Terriglobales bacterium]